MTAEPPPIGPGPGTPHPGGPAPSPRPRIAHLREGGRAARGPARSALWTRSVAVSVGSHAGLLLGLVWALGPAPVRGSDSERAGVEVAWLSAQAAPEPLPEPVEAEPERIEERSTPPAAEMTYPPVPEETLQLEQPPTAAETWFLAEPPEAAPPPFRPEPERPEEDPAEAAEPPPPEPAPLEPDLAEAAETEPPSEPLPEGQRPDIGGDSEPVLEDAPPPDYPALARSRGWQGTVELCLTVAPNGRVQNARVLAGSGHALLDRAAIEAVLEWRFTPDPRGALAGPREVLHNVRFQLNG